MTAGEQSNGQGALPLAGPRGERSGIAAGPLLPLLRATPSRLASFADCPRRYRMTYLDRPPPPRGPAWAHNTMGAAVHVALARFWSESESRRSPLLAGNLSRRRGTTTGFVMMPSPPSGGSPLAAG